MPPAHPRRLLIVDRQAELRPDFRRIFLTNCAESPGPISPRTDFHLDHVRLGDEALKLVERSVAEGVPYALLLVDLEGVPLEEAVEITRRLAQADSETLLVVGFDPAQATASEIAGRLGNSDRYLLVRKPWDACELRQCAIALSERWVVARTDALTGLLNRRSFEQHLRRKWAWHRCTGQPLACVTVDVDYFKAINDRLGHAVGDQVLLLLAELLLNHRRPGDTVCRYGGEEMCILMPGATEDVACRWAEEVRRAIENHAFVIGDDGLQMTGSFGVSATDGTMCHADELIAISDEALRAAKQAGRNKVVCGTEVKQVQAGDHRLREYASYFEQLTAEDVMTGSMVCVNQHMSAADALSTMLQCQITCVPVVDDDGLLTGIITEKDLMESLGSALGWQNSVASVMTCHVIKYEKHTPANVIFDFLCRVPIRRVVIVQEGRPVGIVSRGSYLRWMSNYIESFEPVDVDARLHLQETAGALCDRAVRLKEEIERGIPDDLAPVVTGVTNLQSLLQELLSWAKCSSSRGCERFAGINE